MPYFTADQVQQLCTYAQDTCILFGPQSDLCLMLSSHDTPPESYVFLLARAAKLCASCTTTL